MTQAQAVMIEKALQHAIDGGCQIVGKGTVKATGETFYSVTSARGHKAYCVVIRGRTLECNCRAGQNGQYCKHRALAHQRIKDDALAAEVARQAFAAMQFSATFSMLATINGSAPAWFVERVVEQF